jgi:hypothetical protein
MERDCEDETITLDHSVSDGGCAEPAADRLAGQVRAGLLQDERPVDFLIFTPRVRLSWPG